ncbi:hypothetical protein K492DRAFT_172839 [Lichtheimia hyalospora FSU 10163]|nr:hypothetical protein K492DRAFT_172839 [Lichtheimia hyalospora FSU 10163]
MALKQSTKEYHHQHASNTTCCHCRPTTTTTPLSTRRASNTTTTVNLQVNNVDWHTDKPCWSFKDDYVSFPSLDRFDMIDSSTTADHDQHH